MKNIALKIFDKLRYLICLAILMVIGLITCPLTLLLKWNGFWLLCIVNEKKCSLAKAKHFLQNDPKYQTIYSKKSNSYCCDIDKQIHYEDEIYSYAYRYLPHNIYYWLDDH